MGAVYRLTSNLMNVVRTELDVLQRLGKARPVVGQSFTCGVLCFFFTQPELKDEVDPEGGFPAVLCAVDSLVVVAASWPALPMRVGHRVLKAYLHEARRCVEQPAGIVVAGNLGMHVMHADNLATQAGCLAAAQGSLFIFVADGLEEKSMRFLQVNEPCVALVQGQVQRPQPKYGPLTKRRKYCAVQPVRGERTAEQPARSTAASSSSALAIEDRPTLRLRERTPLYDSFLDSMQRAGAGKDILDFIFRECFCWGPMLL